MELTKRQRQVLDCIARRIEAQGRPPTQRELAERLGVGYAAVQDHLAALEAKGVLRRVPGARGLVLGAKAGSSSQVSLPVLGRVPAGAPVEAVENVEDRISLDKDLAGKADFLLRVRGDSMEPELREGDLVLVRQAAAAESGEIVVACAGQDEATVKRLRFAGRSAWLEPANPKYPAITREFRIIGRVLGLVRLYGR